MTLRWIGQVAIFVLSLTAYLVLDRWVSEDNQFHYLLTEPFYRVQIIGAILLVCLSPQIMRALAHTWRGVVSMSFFVSHAVLRRGRVPVAIVLVGAIAASFGLASLGQGIYAYGYSVARQYKYNEEVSRQIAVEHINLVDAEKGPLASAQALRNFIEWYPDEGRNSDLSARIEKVEAAFQLAETLNFEAKSLKDRGLHNRALELYRLAAEAFPADKRAAAAIDAYKAEFEQQKDQLSALFNLCADRSPATLAASIPALTLLFWDPDDLVAELTGEDEVGRDRAVGRACRRATEANSPEGLVELIDAELFGVRT
jgi:hypothetical protein